MGNNISYQTAEYGKFLQLGANTAFPPISVVRYSYPDNSSAFPENSAVKPLSSVDVYPKYAVLTHLTNADDIKISLSAENINVSLDDLEDLTRIQNGIGFLQSFQLSAITSYVDDLEKNTFDTASACDDVYHETVKLNERLGDSSLFDAFGRLRVSEPKTLLDAKHLYDRLPFIFNEALSGNALSYFVENDSMVVLSTATQNDYAIRQSRHHYNYQPGKSLQAFFTGLFHPQSGIIKRVGLFQGLSAAPYEPKDGIYMEVDENGPKFCIAKTQGTPHSMTFPQSAWNVDKLDGTGPSGITVAMSAAQIFVIDYEWLGLGRVRFGFMQSGKAYYAHYINHINDLDRPYITSPNQPVRYEIRQNGISSGLMHQICSTVMIEGGEDNVGKPISIADGEITSIGTSNYKALLAVRLISKAHDSSVVLKSVEVLNTGSNEGLYDVILNPTYVSTPFIWNDFENTAIQYSTGGATVSGGYSLYKALLAAGLGGSSTTQSLAAPSEVTRLGIGINGVSDVIVLAGKSLTSTTDMVGLMNLLERS